METAHRVRVCAADSLRIIGFGRDGEGCLDGHAGSPSDEPFVVVDGTWEGEDTLCFSQQYADGGMTKWRARVVPLRARSGLAGLGEASALEGGGGLSMVDGRWEGECDGTFSARLVQRGAPAKEVRGGRTSAAASTAAAGGGGGGGGGGRHQSRRGAVVMAQYMHPQPQPVTVVKPFAAEPTDYDHFEVEKRVVPTD